MSDFRNRRHVLELQDFLHQLRVVQSTPFFCTCVSHFKKQNLVFVLYEGENSCICVGKGTIHPFQKI